MVLIHHIIHFFVAISVFYLVPLVIRKHFKVHTDELVLKILQYLSPQEILRVSAVWCLLYLDSNLLSLDMHQAVLSELGCLLVEWNITTETLEKKSRKRLLH